MRQMSFKEFESKAPLFVVGALDDSEEREFVEARQLFGDKAEDLLADCQQLAAVFALTLRPYPVRPETKAQLFSLIRATLHDQ